MNVSLEVTNAMIMQTAQILLDLTIAPAIMDMPAMDSIALVIK